MEMLEIATMKMSGCVMASSAFCYTLESLILKEPVLFADALRNAMRKIRNDEATIYTQADEQGAETRKLSCDY